MSNRVRRVSLGLALVLATRVCLAVGDESMPKHAGRGVIVIVRQDNLQVADLRRAERIATGIFTSIGVPLLFRAGVGRQSDPKSWVSIEMQLHGKAPAQFHDGAFAYALPFGVSGTRIHIFCDRIHNAAHDGGSGTLLGHVMAHEIAHVVEGVSRHSGKGVMKAIWETSDYRQMKSGPLPFDTTDAELIHLGLEKMAKQ